MWSINTLLLLTTRLAVALPAMSPPIRKNTSWIEVGSLAWLAEAPAWPIASNAAEFVVPPLAAGRTDLPSALIVHDRDDETVPAAAGRALAGSWRGSRMIETAGLGHNRLLRDETVIEAVVAFVAAAGVDDDADAAADATGPAHPKVRSHVGG